jgi:hypothetical protein
VHVVRDVAADEYLPAGQLVQEEAAATLILPPMQSVHAEAEPPE